MTTSKAGTELDVEDTAQALMRFASGALGNVHLNYVQRPPLHHFTIVGSSGTISWDQSYGAAPLFRAEAGSWEVVEAPAGYERNDMFLAEIRTFLEIARGRAVAELSLDAGIRVLQLVQAIFESSRLGRRIDLAG